MTVPIRTGGRILTDQLLVNGSTLAFSVPGESFLPVLDALRDVRDHLRLVTCRHEASAANAAEAYGKLVGRPGLCLVTRGPGATHASVGVHTAAQDSTPLILFVGQVARAHAGREAFQEIDLRAVFGGMAKWVGQVDDVGRIPELVARAFAVAQSGRPGPVVLGLPEDVLYDTATVADAGAAPVAQPYPAPDDVDRVAAALAESERPIAVVGGGGWSAEAAAEWSAFARANDLPTAVSFRRQDYVDNDADQYIGVLGLGIDPSLAERVRQADLLLVVGARLGEVTTGGYSLVEAPVPRQRLVHVHPDPEELGRVYHPDVAVNASGPAFAAAMRESRSMVSPPWASWRASARASYEEFGRFEPHPRAVDMAAVMTVLREELPPDTIVANGAGNFTLWVHRYFRYRRYRSQLAPTSGAMGYGLPAAIAAQAVHPDRTVVAVAGDGCFLMAGNELATAVQHDLPILVLVVNNGMYGTIRMHQERAFAGRPHGTDLVNPDFAAYARAFGAYAEVVSETDAFAPALKRAVAAGVPALLELRTDPERLVPGDSPGRRRAR